MLFRSPISLLRTTRISMSYLRHRTQRQCLEYRKSISTLLALDRSRLYSRCHRQIASSVLLVKDVDVTRSTVQKSVVVLASKPLFGPIRYASFIGGPSQPNLIHLKGSSGSRHFGSIRTEVCNLDSGYRSRAHATARRDFTNLEILTDLYKSLELSLKSHLTSSGLYMGECLLRISNSPLSVFHLQAQACKLLPFGSFFVRLKFLCRTFGSRDLVHIFRQRTLILLKALMLQKRVRYRLKGAYATYQ